MTGSFDNEYVGMLISSAYRSIKEGATAVEDHSAEQHLRTRASMFTSLGSEYYTYRGSYPDGMVEADLEVMEALLESMQRVPPEHLNYTYQGARAEWREALADAEKELDSAREEIDG